MRALLTLMRENKPAVQEGLLGFHKFVSEACGHLKIFDPETGDQELIKAVAFEQIKMCRATRCAGCGVQWPEGVIFYANDWLTPAELGNA